MPPTGHRKADSGIASPTGHRRSNNYRKVVAQRSDSRSAEPIRNETGTSVPLSTGRSRERPVLFFESRLLDGQRAELPTAGSGTGRIDLARRLDRAPGWWQGCGSRASAGSSDRAASNSDRPPSGSVSPGSAAARGPVRSRSCSQVAGAQTARAKTQTTPCKARGRPVYIKQQLDAFITCHQATIPRGYPLRGTRLS
ncbi:MAG: hypothetical protein RLZZ116_1431 [Planctomycetota bacterium]|jgi:hypothetical protein